MQITLRQRRLLRWAMAAGAVLLLLGLLFPLLAPRLVDLEAVRGKIEAALSRATGGTVAFDRLDVALLPRPGATVRGLRISVPGAVEGTVESLRLHLQVLPLFAGRLRVATVRAEAPDLAVRFTAAPAQDAAASRPATLAALKRSVSETAARLAALAPNLAVVIHRGRLVLSLAAQPPVAIEGLDARVILPPRRFAVRAACATSIWKRLALDAELDPRTFSAEGSLEVEELRPERLDPFFFSDGASPVGDSLVDLALSFKTDGASFLRAQGNGSAPYLRLLRGGKTLLIERARFKGSFDLTEQRRTFVLDDLEAASPRLALRGELRHDPAASRSGMTVTGRSIDIQALRHAVLFFADDLRPVQAIFSVLQAGDVPAITFASSGTGLSDLADLRQMHITATLRNGSIDIPGTQLHLTGVSGTADIAGGVLEGKDLSARMGRTTGQQGTLRLGLGGGDAPFHLDLLMNADLAELPPVLRAFLRNPSVIGELDLLRDVRGSARGRLILGERLRSISVTADVPAFELSATYQRVPFPLQVSGGRFRFAGGRISLEEVRGTVGNTSFRRLTGGADLAGPGRIEIASAEAALRLNELYRWLLTFPAAARALEGVETVQGSARVALQRLSLPLAGAEGLQFSAAGAVNDVAVTMKDLPGPVIVSRGSFTADQGMLSLANVDAAVLDAALRLDGRLRSAQTGELTATGTVGEKAFRRLSEQFRLPPDLGLRTPVSLSALRVSWRGGDTVDCSGTIAFPQGPSVALELHRAPGALVVDPLQILDGADRISARVRFEQRVLDIAIAGTLREDTLTRIFANERFLHGRLSGNFEAHVPLDHPEGSTARGTLQGERIPVGAALLPRLTIDRIALRADGSTITVDAANVSFRDMHFVFAGTAAAGPEGYAVNGELSVDRLVLDSLLAQPGHDAPAETEAQQPKAPPKGSRKLPLRGTVHFRGGSVAFGHLNAVPVLGDITLTGNGFSATITEASLCGLSITGSAALDGGELSVDLLTAAAGRELGSTMTCLSRDAIRTTGLFDLKVHLTAKGPGRELVSRLDGSVEFQAKKGRIDQAENLMRILALLNITELLRGKMPDLRKEGIAYDSLKLRGAVRRGTLHVAEAVLDGSVLTVSGSGAVDLPNKSVDAVLLVAPFKTFDAVINAIPGVRYIMGGNLIAVPVRLRGPVEKPEVSVMKASDVGDQLVGLATRVLKLPFKIVEPVLPGEKKAP